MFSIFRISRPDRVEALVPVDRSSATPDVGAPAPRAGLRRTVPSEQDRALSSEARQWLRSLPGRERPLALCSMYPRLANRLAAVWDDPEQTEAVFDELMIDRRGGRLGFAPLVAGELMRLHRLHEKRLDSNKGE
ncbi:MAG: hypothetical protein K2Q07_06845 [Burkholderiaceae bacterium]|nr:hypothetical protein [Burkholderiaceae bacterium]